VPPWELEARADAQWWINEALTMKSAENLGESIAMDIAQKKAKK
jgi:hypothetical protein